MAVRLQSPKGNGWLILLRDKPNVLVMESISMTTETVEFKYGCTVKETIRISSSQWREFASRCGIRQ